MLSTAALANLAADEIYRDPQRAADILSGDALKALAIEYDNARLDRDSAIERVAIAIAGNMTRDKEIAEWKRRALAAELALIGKVTATDDEHYFGALAVQAQLERDALVQAARRKAGCL